MRLGIVMALLALGAGWCEGQAPSPSPSVSPAPAPAPPFVNITQIVLNGGQFSNLLALLQSTGLGNSLQGMINQTLAQSSAPGITLFAPTDAAFAASGKLLAGLNSTLQQRLLGYHVLQNFYSLQVLQQASNNVSATYATYNGDGGGGGGYMLNITSPDHGTVTLSTGYNSANITSTLSDNSPAAVFGIGAVLLPTDIFGVPGPSPAPSPSPEAPSSLSPPGASGPDSSSAEPPKNPAPPSLSPGKLFSVLLLLLSVKFLPLL